MRSCVANACRVALSAMGAPATLFSRSCAWLHQLEGLLICIQLVLVPFWSVCDVRLMLNVIAHSLAHADPVAVPYSFHGSGMRVYIVVRCESIDCDVDIKLLR